MTGFFSVGGTWRRIIPASKWLGSPLFISHLAHLEGPYIGNLLTVVITGMILQVVPTQHISSFFLDTLF